MTQKRRKERFNKQTVNCGFGLLSDVILWCWISGSRRFERTTTNKTASHLRILNYAAAEASYNDVVNCYELYSVGGG
jgi:hypothetical protein